MAHDQQQNTGRVKKGRLHANLEYLSLVHDLIVLFMFILMTGLT